MDTNLDDILGGNSGQFEPTIPNANQGEPNTPPVVPTTTTPSTPPVEPTTPNQHIPTIGDTTNYDTYDGIIQLLSKPELTDAEKEIKDGLSSMFKAEQIDQNGNLVNQKGEIVLTAASLKDYVEKDILPLDDKGNLVDAQGNVLTTSADLVKNESVVEYTKLKLEEELGVSFPTDKTFDDTEEGIAELVIEAVKIKNQNAVLGFLNNNPVIKDFYQHIALGNDPKSFSGDFTDYSKVDVKTLSTEAKLQLIEKSYKEKGIEDTSEFIDLIKKGGEELISSKAEDAKLALNKLTETKRKERDNELKAKELKRREEVQQYWNEVASIVEKGQVRDINIPVAERKAFLDYMSKTTENGKSQEQLDIEKEDTDFDVMVSFLRFKKYDISKLAKVIANNDKVQSMRERMNKRSKNLSSSTKNFGNTNRDSGVLSLDTLI
jgi:hypothetical protein